MDHLDDLSVSSASVDTEMSKMLEPLVTESEEPLQMESELPLQGIFNDFDDKIYELK